MAWINIPKNWIGKQALTVVEFLDDLSAAIWKDHEPKMLEEWRKRLESNEPSVREHFIPVTDP